MQPPPHTWIPYLLSGIVALLASCSDGGTASPLEPVPDPDAAPAVLDFVHLVNEHRAAVACAALTWNGEVAEVAQAHSDDMVARDFFDHTNPDGQSPGHRLDAAGISWSRWAENIAFGYPSGEAVLNGWLASPGHRENIENCALTEHGVGLTDQHWTHVFRTP